MNRSLEDPRTPNLLIILDILACISVVGALVWVLFFTPREAIMGDVQKIFYFHVSAAWVGMLGFLVAFISGLFELRTRKRVWDVSGASSVEIGMVFIVLAIIAGSIWARPVWNTWWTWEPRLTTAFVMVLIYAAYFILRGSLEEPESRARISAIYAIVGFVSVPFTFVSIRLFRSLHPVLFGEGTGGLAFVMDDRMVIAFVLALIAFSLLFAALFWHRLRLGLRQLPEVVERPSEEGEERA
jgi:heme exporter protein C